jgi:hypothetical protein
LISITAVAFSAVFLPLYKRTYKNPEPQKSFKKCFEVEIVSCIPLSLKVAQQRNGFGGFGAVGGKQLQAERPRFPS